jgi:hypothetical protein
MHARKANLGMGMSWVVRRCHSTFGEWSLEFELRRSFGGEYGAAIGLLKPRE